MLLSERAWFMDNFQWDVTAARAEKGRIDSFLRSA